ncbi:hypothetical protein [Moorena sp. SIO3B2]|uniref:hypothetical protein n=1 Tax=Moorena sp. SIO3B2 TaxID=2607827 RepID=UPI0013CCE412|nr:hypothetical protein [Moorena sp. SIO3B2]NEP36352.1 hypothetical protein [Moorena sp. SIO3B2]
MHPPCSLFPIPDSRFPIPDSRFPIPDSRFPIPEFNNCLLLLITVLIKINMYHISKIWITEVKPDLISNIITIIA